MRSVSGGVVLLASIGCVVQSEGTRPLPAAETPLVVDAEGQKMSLKACAANEVLRTNAAGAAWECASVATGQPFDPSALQAQIDVVAARPPFDASSLQAQINALTVRINSLEDSSCPRGYAIVGGGGNVVLCRRTVDGGTDDIMKVGDGWIDRFEVSACGGGTLGGPSGNQTTALACSRAGVVPALDISYFQAARMCANAGKHLCSNAEWQAAASGTPEGPPCTVASASQITGDPARNSCVSAFGVHDMAGNFWEWVDAWHGSPDTTAGGRKTWRPEFGTAANIDGYGSSAFVGDGGSSGGGAPVPNHPSVLLRGGSGGAGSIFTISINQGPDSQSGFITARCCLH